MEIISTQKFIHLSPKKIRPVAAMVAKLNTKKAVEVLPFLNKKGAYWLEKCLKTAIANAKNLGYSEELLQIKEIQVLDGPRLKRGRPVSKGRWHPIKKRLSHIRVVLNGEKSKETDKKTEIAKDQKQDKTKKAEVPATEKIKK